jgi:hypothetical protein
MPCTEISSTIQKRRFVELNIGNAGLSRATVDFGWDSNSSLMYSSVPAETTPDILNFWLSDA